MRFADYMEEWLYGEEGYYRKFREIGKQGDFYTAVSTSAFFGAAIANELWRQIRAGRVPRDAWLIEIGAHRGYLLADMIQWLYTCDPSLVETMRFATVERQPEVRRAQRDYFGERFGSGVRLEQFASLEEVSVPFAWYVSNEIFDAFPCDLYKEGRRAEVEGEAILWVEAEAELREFARRHGMSQGEIARGYGEFARRVADSAEALAFVSFDYGERYVRNDFSIRIYRGHETLPLFDEALRLSEVFKEADITYDVNFGHVIEAFEGVGMALEHYETQARALVRYGLIEILEQYARQASRERYLRQADRVKTLIAPTMMGDRFKVVEFGKGI